MPMQQCPVEKPHTCLILRPATGYLFRIPRGATKEATVGRVKIELRPLLLIEAEYQGRKVSAILQNAETIRLVREDGSACSVASLKTGDIVMGTVTESGRHFGVAVKEHIIEK